MPDPYLTCDALDDLGSDPFALDFEIMALADLAAFWLWQVEIAAASLGLTVPEGIEALRQRMHTGYMPKEQRRDLRHRTYRDGLRTAPRRRTADDRAQAEAARWGMLR